jgi:hypothetical protein
MKYSAVTLTWVPCHRVMACPCVEDGEGSLQVCRVAGNMDRLCKCRPSLGGSHVTMA